MRGMLPIRGAALALLVTASGACGHTDRAATPDNFHYADVSHALDDLSKQFARAELLEVEDHVGPFAVDKYNVEADGIRFTDVANRRFLFIPWERWTAVKVHRFRRDYFVSFEDEDIELRYTSRIDRPARGTFDGQRFFAAIRYLAREHRRLETSLKSQPVDMAILERARAEKDCSRTGSVQRKVDELREGSRHAPWSQIQLDARPALGTLPDAYAGWLAVAHNYLHTCGQPPGFPPEVLEGAGSVGQPVVEEAIESRDCVALGAIAKLDLWPYDDHFASAVRERDFKAAEATRREWVEALKETKVRCGKALATEGLNARIDALRQIVGLDDEGLIKLRSELLAALEAGDAEALLASARAVAAREKIVDPPGEAAHQARLVAVEAMIDQEIRGGPKPASGSVEAQKRALRQTLALFGLQNARLPQ